MSEKGSRPLKANMSDLPNFRDRWEVFQWVVNGINQQRITEREKVRAAMKAGGFPVPVQVLKKLAQLNPEDLFDVLSDHPGFAAWKR